ncbi:hypothetical protein Adt_14781 [Abeliophyllum distichum]|uniref:Uncharacterized protein n=1 Tax=Abeliophyllum distichum TaxID=126358 RepID=A0ABD1U0M5_9LAMI
MGSTNTKLGLENKALRSNVEALASTEANLKAKQMSVLENVRVAEMKVVEALSYKKITESAMKRAEEQIVVAKKSISSVNHNFDAMVTEKDKQLVDVKEELKKLREELVTTVDSVVEAETKLLGRIREIFLTRLSILHLATRFIEVEETS